MRSLKAPIRRLLERSGYNDRFRDSALYGIYLAVVHPRHAALTRRVGTFYGQLLAEAGRGWVFDIGANRGERTRIFSAFADRVVSVEPDAYCQAVLRRRFGRDRRITIVRAGVAELPGVKPFFQFDEDGSGFNTLSAKWVSAQEGRPLRATVEVPITTLDALIAEYGCPTYIKVDVEGSELDVVRGLSTPVPLLSVECILPEFLAESLELLAILHQRFPDSRFNYSVGEAPQALEEREWVSSDAMAGTLRTSQRRFIEMYCRQP